MYCHLAVMIGWELASRGTDGHMGDDGLGQSILMISKLHRAEYCAARLKVLAEPIRLQILSNLWCTEMSVSQLAASIGQSVATVSHHLQVLHESELVVRKRAGRRIVYSVHPNVAVKGDSSVRHLDLGCCRVVFSGA